MSGTAGLVASIIIAVLAIIIMFVCILRFPKLRIGKFSIDTFWIPTFVGALLLIIIIKDVGKTFIDSITTNNSLNPLKILVLFISVSFLSVTLDDSGFFSFIASLFVSKYHNSQIKLFLVLYVLISILTIFTSNDIVILTFTPFIIFLSKKGNINPIPYLVMEFAAANTYSMMLEIGNPTNVYLSGVYEIPFLDYFLKMAIPSILCGLASLLVLLLIFRKDLKKEIEVFQMNVSPLRDKKLCIVSGSILLLATITLAISNYINLEMYIVAVIYASVLLLFLIIYSIYKQNLNVILNPIKRIPYNLIPFVLSMFAIIIALESFNLFGMLGNAIESIGNEKVTAIIYLIVSILSCNIVNNIPMTLAFSSVLGANASLTSIYAVIMGSNIGALLTPIGALAGIMWLRILKETHIKYSFFDFIKNGFFVTLTIIGVAIISILILL